MNYTIENLSQLQQGLERMRRPSEIPSPSRSGNNTPTTSDVTDHNLHTQIKQENITPDYHIQSPNIRPHTSATRTNSSQMSSSSLLLNIAALQTTTNNKLDKLVDAIYGLHNAIDKVNKEQVRQSELLVSIVRNTANIKISTSESQISSKSTKAKNGSIKEYGFATTKQLFAEFIMKLLQQIQIQIIGKNKQYKSTRDMNLKLTTQIVSVAMDNEFKINGISESKIDANSQTHPSLVKVANSIGSIDDTNPMLTPEAFREIFEDVESKFFVSCLQKIIERMRIIRLLVPFYEADIISSIEFPYFNKNGEVICNWHKIIPRNESVTEALISTASISDRKKLAQYLARGLTERAAVGAAIGNI